MGHNIGIPVHCLPFVDNSHSKPMLFNNKPLFPGELVSQGLKHPHGGLQPVIRLNNHSPMNLPLTQVIQLPSNHPSHTMACQSIGGNACIIGAHNPNSLQPVIYTPSEIGSYCRQGPFKTTQY